MEIENNYIFVVAGKVASCAVKLSVFIQLRVASSLYLQVGYPAVDSFRADLPNAIKECRGDPDRELKIVRSLASKLPWACSIVAAEEQATTAKLELTKREREVQLRERRLLEC